MTDTDKQTKQSPGKPDSLSGIKKDIAIVDILEYKSQGLTHAEIGQLVGCSKQNISDRLKAFKTDFIGLETFKNKRADILALFQKRLLYSLTDKDIKKMPGGSRVLAVAQLFDKEQVERGKPTQIVGYQDIQGALGDVDSEIAALEAEIADLEG